MAPEASLRYWFDAVDTDRSGQLSTEELQRALINGKSKETQVALPEKRSKWQRRK